MSNTGSVTGCSGGLQHQVSAVLPSLDVSYTVSRAAHRQMTWSVFRRVSVALLAGGCTGTGIGVAAGAAVGVFVYIVGALFGAIIAMPFGFVAGIIGTAIGGSLGWAIGGGASLGIPLLLFGLTTGNPVVNCIALCGTLYGSLIGAWYGKRARQPHILLRENPGVAPPDFIGLYEIDIAWRLVAMFAVFLTIGAMIWDAYRFATAGW